MCSCHNIRHEPNFVYMKIALHGRDQHCLHIILSTLLHLISTHAGGSIMLCGGLSWAGKERGSGENTLANRKSIKRQLLRTHAALKLMTDNKAVEKLQTIDTTRLNPWCVFPSEVVLKQSGNVCEFLSALLHSSTKWSLAEWTSSLWGISRASAEFQCCIAV